jgi:hypothetical protein
MRLLFRVEETFNVPGRGVVLLPELRPIGPERFSVGDPLVLKHPSGIEENVRIEGLCFLTPRDFKCQLVVMLSGKNKDDIPIGTEVWSIDKTDRL